MAPTPIRIDAEIAAPPQKVWSCWTNPEHITKWNFASDDWQCPRATNDLRVGGKYVARMEAKDGSFGFDFEATYDDVVNEKKLAYTMPDGRKVVTEFAPSGSGTKVTTLFDADTQHPADFQKSGWQAILNNFKKYVEQTR